MKNWETPKDLSLSLPEAPPLSPSLIPKPLRTWILDAAERKQVPLEMIAVPAMIALGSVVGRQVGIHPKQYDDWLVIPNNYAMVVGRPGTLKSPAQAEGLRPLEMLAKEAAAKYKAVLPSYLAGKEVCDIQIKAIKAELGKVAAGNESTNTTDELTHRLEEVHRAQKKPVERRFKTNDPTVEKLAELLEENPNGLCLVRDEFSGFLRSLEKWGREGDREFYLEGWNGDTPFDIDRIKRGTIHVSALCLSIIGGIQPDKLTKYVEEATDGGEGGDGLLQRFQLSVFPEDLDWELVDREPDAEAFKQATEVFKRLAYVGESKSDGSPITLRFSPEAQEFFNDWYSGLQKRLRSGTIDCPAFESHLLKYASTMPSLALLIHLSDSRDWQGQELKPVSFGAAVKAARWCDFLEQHARKIYFGVLRSDHRAARALAKKIEKGEIIDRQTVREVYRKQWSSLGTPDLVLKGLKILEDLNWIKMEETNTQGPGRSSSIIRINPGVATSAKN